MSTIPKGPSTKDKLATIVKGFDDFDSEMRKGTRVKNYIHLIELSEVSFISFLAKAREG